MQHFIYIKQAHAKNLRTVSSYIYFILSAKVNDNIDGTV